MAISLEEASAWNVGQDIGNLAGNLVRSARDAYCSVYRADPLSVKNFAVSTPVGSAIAAINEQFCKNVPPAPGGAISVPLSGGQCPTLYRVENIWTGNFDPGFGNPLVPTNGTAGSNLLGPIVSVSTSIVDSGVAGNPFQSQILVTNAAGASQQLRSGPSSTRPTGRFNLIRLDGGEDNCGDPIPPPAPDPVPSPDPGVKYVPVPLPLPYGGVYVVPVILKPVITLAPEINLQIGPFNVNIGPNEINIAPNFDFDPDFEPPPIPNIDPVPQPKPLPPGGGGPTKCPDPCEDYSDELLDLKNRAIALKGVADDTKELAEDIKECACEPPTTFSTSALGGGNSVVASLPEFTKRVRVSITGGFNSLRDQHGGDVGPTVYYAGWYAFGRGGRWGDRLPLSYGQNLLSVPEGYTEFSCTFKGSATGTATAEIETPQEG